MWGMIIAKLLGTSSTIYLASFLFGGVIFLIGTWFRYSAENSTMTDEQAIGFFALHAMYVMLVAILMGVIIL